MALFQAQPVEIHTQLTQKPYPLPRPPPRIRRAPLHSGRYCQGRGGGGGVMVKTLGADISSVTFPEFLPGLVPLASQNPTLLYSILWPIVDPILVTFGQMCNFRDPNLVSYYLYELTHFLD